MIKSQQIVILTKEYNQFIIITEQVEEIVKRSGIKEGIVYIITNHTTTGIAVNEGLECIQSDIMAMLRRIAPEEGIYSHARFLESYGAMANNAPGHLKGHLTGNHCVFQVENYAMKRRFAQEIYLCEFDGPQERTISIVVMGE